MPAPSFYPLVAAAGLPVAGWGALFAGPGHVALVAVGLAVVAAGVFGWAFEPSIPEPVEAARSPVPAGHPEHR